MRNRFLDYQQNRGLKVEMKVYTEAGTYVLTAADTTPFCVSGDDIEIVGPSQRVSIKQVIRVESEIMIITGKRITLKNLEFNIDYTRLPTDIKGEFFGVVCKGCKDLSLENCRSTILLKARNHLEVDEEKSVNFAAVNILDCHRVTIKEPSNDIRQILPDGTVVQHVSDEHSRKVYVNGYLLTQPNMISGDLCL